MSISGERVVRRLGGRATTRTGLRIAGALCVAASAWALLGSRQAWASGSEPYFTKLGAAYSPYERREGAIAATLPNGDVLIAGGDNAAPFANAELFNPATDTFATTSDPVFAAREGAIAATLPNGEILIAGGAKMGTDGSELLASAELFNPATSTFTALTGTDQSLTVARFGAIAAPLPDGDILIAGGIGEDGYLSGAELFNPETDTFAALTGAGRSPATERYAAVAAPLPNGEVLIAGGEHLNTNITAVVASAELFDPETDTFAALTATGHLLVPRAEAIAATLPDGEVLVAGGINGQEQEASGVELFDPATDDFTTLTGNGGAPVKLVEARAHGDAALLANGEVLISGGNGNAGGLDAELFFPAAQALIAGGSFGEQIVGEQSAATVLTVQNLGAQPLTVVGASLGGAQAADFRLLADDCQGRTLAFDGSCTITASFTPSAEGVASATLTLQDNEPGPAAVTLTGTGVPADRGPRGERGETGERGPGGAQGEKGAASATGAKGATGTAVETATLRQTSSGDHVELVTCTTATKSAAGKENAARRCSTKQMKSTPKFTASGVSSAKASLTRSKRAYATGQLVLDAGVPRRLVLDIDRGKALRPGAYTLTLTWTVHKKLHTSRQRIELQ